LVAPASNIVEEYFAGGSVRLGPWLRAVCALLCLIFCLKALLAQALSVAPPPATASPAKLPLPANAVELDALLSQKNYLKLGQIFKNTNGFDEVVMNMTWQRSKFLAGATAFINFSYIANLDRVSTALGDVRGAEMKKTAILMLLYTYEVILIDGTKCKDVSAPAHRKDQLLMTFPNVAKSIAAISDADMDTLVKRAIKWEGLTAPRRADDDFLCRNGLVEMQAAMTKYGKDATREVPTPPGGVGKTMEVKTDPDYKPEFLGTEVWSPKQAELRASMPDILSKLVSGVRKQK
jgi:hypothetical protein